MRLFSLLPSLLACHYSQELAFPFAPSSAIALFGAKKRILRDMRVVKGVEGGKRKNLNSCAHSANFLEQITTHQNAPLVILECKRFIGRVQVVLVEAEVQKNDFARECGF